jgi:hypothetical protein
MKYAFGEKYVQVNPPLDSEKMYNSLSILHHNSQLKVSVIKVRTIDYENPKKP